MATNASASSLAAVLSHFEQRRPLRAGSLIVTVFGDAIAPRGGSLWLGSLLEIMELFGVEGGLVRTALSRLVQENWFERSRTGKKSFYRLSGKGAGKFALATRRIYHAPETAWDGTFQMALLAAADPKQRSAARDGLAALGFGQAAPTLMLRPAARCPPSTPEGNDVIWLSSRLMGDAAAGQRLAASAWQLDEIESAYARFIAAFQPLLKGGRAGHAWDDAQAFRLRIVLVHEYRRIILRDPLLPRALLADRWPGFAARQLCKVLYQLAVPGSERWLDTHAATQAGPLPAPDPAFWQRFEEG